MTKAVQPRGWPTRKLTIGVLVASATSQIWDNVAPDYFPVLSGPDVSMLAGFVVSTVVGGVVAWFVKDNANIPDEGAN